MFIRGTAKLDTRTKNLTPRLRPGDIAIIDHAELDDVAAHALVEARVKAVINAAPSLSNRYPNPGPLTLVQNGIVLLDDVGREIFQLVTEGQTVEISGSQVLLGGQPVAGGRVLTEDEIKAAMASVKSNMQTVLEDFVINTLEYARQEIGLISGQYPPPRLKTNFRRRQALIVVRGQNYREDLTIIRSYIDEVRPVLIGVDGGADALLDFGLKPDLIVGDMDSVSDRALCCGAELVVHAYRDGRAPGLSRVQKLGRSAHIYAAPGTSEDIAMLLAYEHGAELLVAVGTHSNMQDFLEKGRRGMASTFLVRLKVGSILVDAKGVSKLYRARLTGRHVAQIALAALIPVLAAIFVSPSARELLRLLYINVRALIGI